MGDVWGGNQRRSFFVRCGEAGPFWDSCLPAMFGVVESVTESKSVTRVTIVTVTNCVCECVVSSSWLWLTLTPQQKSLTHTPMHDTMQNHVACGDLTVSLSKVVSQKSELLPCSNLDEVCFHASVCAMA